MEITLTVTPELAFFLLQARKALAEYDQLINDVYEMRENKVNKKDKAYKQTKVRRDMLLDLLVRRRVDFGLALIEAASGITDADLERYCAHLDPFEIQGNY